jgi:hypothetical protein
MVFKLFKFLRQVKHQRQLRKLNSERVKRFNKYYNNQLRKEAFSW